MSINTVPERLTAFRVYLDGSSDLKGITDIQLPSLEPLTDTVSGAGIAGEYDSPTLGHFKSMTLTLNFRTATSDLFSLLRQQSQRLDCRGAFQEYDAGSGTYQVKQTRIVVQGPPTKNDPGKLQTGTATSGSVDISVLYLKIDVDGVNKVEIDKLNYKCVIDGVDYLANVRTALGLS